MLVVDVEEIAHETPAVAEHLRVFRGGLDADAHSVEVETTVVAAGSAGSPHHPPTGAGPEEEVLAVVGDRDRCRLLDEVLRIPVLDGVLEQLSAPETSALHHEHGAFGPGRESRVVFQGQSGRVDDAAGDAVEVDRDGRGRVLAGTGRTAPGATSAVTRPLAAGPRTALFALLVILRLLIAPRQERRRLVLVEQRQVEGARDRPVVGGHVEPAGVQAVVGGGQEVEVLAGLIPHRGDGVGHAVGELVRLARLGVVHEDRPQLVVEPARVGDPARIGRPHRVHGALRVGEAVGVDVRPPRPTPRPAPARGSGYR